ncbi:unnamed protein product [Ectocarpus sp. CCAP 1310/34]|nr:unnamed protein product [Ectocarpus sp. CCAP 1310/34]
MRGRGELPRRGPFLSWTTCTRRPRTSSIKEYLAKHCNTLAWYGPSECTDEVQPVDAGAGRFLKVEVGRQMDIWLEQSDNLERWETASLTASDRRVLITQWMGAAMARLNSHLAYRYRLFENDDEQGLENGNDEPEGRAEEGDGGRETLMEGVDSSDKTTATDELALLDDDDSMDPQDPEDEIQGMEIPAGFRIQEAKPVALDRLLLRRGVLVRLGMGWFGGLITQQSQKDTRHLYDYCVQLELDQSTRKMKLPLDKLNKAVW